MKKNLDPSDTRAVQPVAQRLAAWATWPIKRISVEVQNVAQDAKY